jgi:hypothetical protein
LKLRLETRSNRSHLGKPASPSIGGNEAVMQECGYWVNLTGVL